MSDENFRRELNQVFDDVAGSPSSNLRDRVQSAVSAAPEARGPYWIAAVAAAVIAVLLVGVLVMGGPLKRPTSPARPAVTQSTPSPFVSQGPAATPTPVYTCAAQDFKTIAPGEPTPPVAFVSALRTGTHGSYDRITIEFGNGVPHDVQISAPSAGTTFTLSPSGQQATLKGDHGILITIHGSDLHTSYTGSTDIVTGDPTIAEVRRVQDFEGVVQLGLGVNGTGCYNAYWMAGPDRLVIDVARSA